MTETTRSIPNDDPDHAPRAVGSTSRIERSGVRAQIDLQDLWDDFDAENTDSEGRLQVEQLLSDYRGDERYVVIGEVGRGGMGSILRAIDRDIRRPVAMKVLHGPVDDEQRARFAEEAQITGQLEHPNIVPIHELGIDADGRLFFTMKIVRGRSLGAILDDLRENGLPAEERYPPGMLLHALLHACDAIAYAHSRGVVHRDLKPGNIMLGEYGEVLVMDWGLAKIGATRAFRQKRENGLSPTTGPVEAAVPAVAVPAAVRSSLNAGCERVRSFRHDSSIMITRDGTVAGTPAYMSPEQARGEIAAIDERSDIYGLGSILYEILTLEPPTEGATDDDYLENAKEGRVIAPRRRAPRRRIPAELESICLKALSKSPDERYQTVEDLRRALTEYMDQAGAGRRSDRRGHGLLRIGLAALAVLAALILAVLYADAASERDALKERLAQKAAEPRP